MNFDKKSIKIPLSRPSITENEINAVVEVMKSGHIAQGEQVREFEESFARCCKAKYAIAVSSGTAGLFLALKAVGVGRGQKVITTPFSFVASTNVIYQVGASPFYVDISEETYNLDVRKLIRSGMLTGIGAILPVDVFGVPFDTNRVKGLPIILDSCESLGSNTDRPFDVAVYAFYPNKQITTGEGAMIVTNNKDVADFCRAMRNQGRKPTDAWLTNSYMGFNFRMTDIQAAIGREQLKRIDEIIEKRQDNVWTYINTIIRYGLDERLKVQTSINHSGTSPFVFTVQLDNRDRVLLYLKNKGIETKPYFPCIHLQPYMLERGFKPGMFPVAERISERILALPFYTDMQEEEIEFVVSALGEAIENA